MKNAFWILACTAFCAHAQTQTKLVCNLPKTLDEYSGLISVNGKFWGLNDGQNPDRLYSFDLSGEVLDSTTFENTSNVDWEALAANDSLVFIGDIGNNNSNRKNLRIYFFPVALLGQKNVHVDTIAFHYPEQSEFQANPLGIYDCESMIALKDRIYLLSKSYGDAKCRLYELPIKTGVHDALLRDSSSLYFWLTDALLWKDTLHAAAYMYLGSFTEYYWKGVCIKEGRFLGTGDVEELTFAGADQWESICTPDGIHWYAACEGGHGNPAALYELVLPLNSNNGLKGSGIEIFSPNPAGDVINIFLTREYRGSRYCILDSSGKLVASGDLKSRENRIDISALKPGTYTLCTQKGKKTSSLNFIKR